MAKLKEEFKQKWLTALRSGEHKQCTDHLELDEGYCCLGIALLVQYASDYGMLEGALTQEDEMPKQSDALHWWEEAPKDPSQIYNPLVKLESMDDEGMLRSRWLHLSELNDEEGYTFAEIADLIEAQL